MQTIMSFLSLGFSYIVPLIVLLGLLVFVHELGHFLVAKWFGVKVEVFSLGFGPKLLKYVKGETTYCLSAIPLGGYVKMFGEDVTAEMSSDLKDRAFMHKPPSQRILIALAGPIMNLFFAFFIFTAIGLIGETQLKPLVGDISKNSPAFAAGFRAGDLIEKINDTQIENWQQAEDLIAENGNKNITFAIKRSDSPTQISLTPEVKPNENPVSTKTLIGKVVGLSPYQDIPIILTKNRLPFFEQLDLAFGDIVTELNGTKVNTLTEFKELLKKISTTDKFSVSLQRLQADDSYKDLKFEKQVSGAPGWNNILADSLDDSETYVSNVGDKTPAATAGLLKNDKIVRINNVEIFDFEDIVEQVSKYKEGGSPLKIEYLRNFELKSVEIVPNKTDITDHFGTTETRYTIGIRPMKGVYAPTFNWKPTGASVVFKYGLDKTWEWTVMTVMSFVRLFQNKVSPKNLGGFISIGQMAQKSWEIGASAFLKIMGIISINLFVLNLLPIPILDGGHIVIFTAEILNGKPLNPKKIELAQQVGMFLILFLMVFSLFNDFSRILG